MRRAARTDATQADIVECLRTVGAKVAITSQLGGGFPDLVAAFRGKWYLLEVKDENKPPSARKLTEDGQEWHLEFGTQAPVHVVHNRIEALKAICCEIQ
jgi:hypothetical protein